MEEAYWNKLNCIDSILWSRIVISVLTMVHFKLKNL